jgi:hypothetical protein
VPESTCRYPSVKAFAKGFQELSRKVPADPTIISHRKRAVEIEIRIRIIECMEALAIRADFPLVYGRDGRRQEWPETTAYLQVKTDTGGRPGSLAKDDGTPLLIEASADIDDLCRAVDEHVGGYLLFPHTADHKKLPMIGYVQISPDHVGLAAEAPPAPATVPSGVDGTMLVNKALALVHRMIESNETNNMLLRESLASICAG